MFDLGLFFKNIHVLLTRRLASYMNPTNAPFFVDWAKIASMNYKSGSFITVSSFYLVPLKIAIGSFHSQFQIKLPVPKLDNNQTALSTARTNLSNAPLRRNENWSNPCPLPVLPPPRAFLFASSRSLTYFSWFVIKITNKIFCWLSSHA